MACLIALINAPHLWRNWRTFGSPLGPAEARSLSNETHSAQAIASVLVRNVAVHAQFVPFRTVENAVHRAHRLLGLSANDPRITYRDTKFIVWEGLGEDYAGSPLHVLLAIVAIAYCVSGGGTRRSFAGCLAAGILLFCAALKWQPWITRLQLPGFVLASVVAGAAFPGRKKITAAIGALLLLAAVFPATVNKLRPLATDASIFRRDSISLRFAARPELQSPYMQAAAILSQSRRVGIVSKDDSWDYPLWILAPDVKFEYSNTEETLVSLDGAAVPPGYDALFASPAISVYRLSARR